MQALILLGSTGSIGIQALEVAKAQGIRISALAAGGGRLELLEAQAREWKPEAVAVFEEAAAETLKIRLADTDIKVLAGKNGVCEAVRCSGATVLNAIVGIAGLRPTLAAIEAGKAVALANKETLVTAGSIVMRRAAERGVKIIPVDSEHSAIFQSLQGAPQGSLRKILLTASGGPFFGKKRSELLSVTAAEALKHPNWSMGAKITVDSATLMNKGLEVIEAVHLFGVPADKIEVLVHRQSIFHSAVELSDGAVIAQLGTPDMRLPIQYALTYPSRGEAFERLDLLKCGALTFEKPDTETFRCLPLCIEAINRGGIYPAAANGANEEAVAAFLKGRIKFLEIAELVEEALIKATPTSKAYSVEDVEYTDAQARRLVKERLGL